MEKYSTALKLKSESEDSNHIIKDGKDVGIGSFESVDNSNISKESKEVLKPDTINISKETTETIVNENISKELNPDSVSIDANSKNSLKPDSLSINKEDAFVSAADVFSEAEHVQDMLDDGSEKIIDSTNLENHQQSSIEITTIEEPSNQLKPPTPLLPQILTMENNPYDPTIAFYNELLRKDVILTFRLLCRLSLHTGAAQPSPSPPAEKEGAEKTPEGAKINGGLNDELPQTSIRARVLALELILSILNNSGEILQTEEVFISLIRQHLCISISKNGISTHPQLFELSLSLFLMLLRLYRSSLVIEIEILMNTVYLHILDMGNSTYKQKSMVLQGLLKICENGQCLVDLFLNYDCNLNLMSVFERIVNVCARVAQGGRIDPIGGAPEDGNWTKTKDQLPPPPRSGIISLVGDYVGDYVGGGTSKAEVIKVQEARLKLRGLCCLVAIVNSLVEWSSEVNPDLPLVEVGGKISLLVPPDSPKKNGTAAGELVIVDRRPLTVISLAQQAISNSFGPHTRNSSAVGLNNIGGSHSNRSSSVDGSMVGFNAGPSNVGEAEELTTRKQQLRQAIKLFNIKPNKGVALFQSNGFIKAGDSVECANFLKSTIGLDKRALGDFLGDIDKFNLEVMHSFIDSMSFKDTDFVDSLRMLLQTFRLPGEAQKIDRIMEKFADRYCETNPDLFAKADTAYTLAFSVIMLNTDQHSTQIRHKMDKAAFIKNNRGINDNGDLPDEFLSKIFDEIRTNEIVMEEEQAGKFAKLAVGWGAGDLENDLIRTENYRKEIAMIQKKSQLLIKQAIIEGRSNSQTQPSAVFNSAMHAELARPMFSMASWSLMATFSLLFESAVDEEDDTDWEGDLSNFKVGNFELCFGTENEPKVADLCLQGFSGAIRVASLFKMETERDAFVSSMAKMTGLSHVSDLKPKNVKAIKTLFSLACILSEFLDRSWVSILEVVSTVERVQLAWNTAADHLISPPKITSSEQNMVEKESSGRRSSYYVRPDDLILFFATAKLSPMLKRVYGDLSGQSMAIVVDSIFSKTVHMSANAIIHFFKGLCIVSLEEVGLGLENSSFVNSQKGALSPGTGVINGISSAMSGPPRIFLLQKIVEIAHYNINRIRFEWSQIWKQLQPHFNSIACHPSVTVATFAVDSLRQLSMKFLEKDELSHYNTQHEFLKSFEFIMRNNIHPTIRELILSSLSQMIKSKSSNIKSGWKSIFVVLCKAATPPNHVASKGDINIRVVNHGALNMTSQEWEKLTALSFGFLETIFNNYIDAVTNAGGFVDFVSALSEFASLDGSGTVHDEVCSSSLKMFGDCAKWLVEKAEEDKCERNKGITTSTKHLNQQPLPSPVQTPDVSNRRESLNTLMVDAKNLLSPFTEMGMISEDHFYLKLFPLLSAMGRVAASSRVDSVQTEMIQILFDTLLMSSDFVQPRFWKPIYRSIISPIFEDFKDLDSNDANDHSQSEKTRESNSIVWPLALQKLVDLISNILEGLAGSKDGLDLLKGVLDLILSMLGRKDEKLAMTGEVCLNQFLQKNFAEFSKLNRIVSNDDGTEYQLFTVITETLEKACWITLPAELLMLDISEFENFNNFQQQPTSDSPIISSPLDSSSEDKSLSSTLMVSIAAKDGGQAALRALTFGNKAEEQNVKLKNLDKLDFQHTITKCGAHLELMEAIRSICFSVYSNMDIFDDGDIVVEKEDIKDDTAISSNIDFDKISGVSIKLIPKAFWGRWVQLVYDSYILAKSFNSNLPLRQAIFKKRLVRQLPNLTKQETTSCSTYISLLFFVYKNDSDEKALISTAVFPEGKRMETTFDLLVREILDVFDRFSAFIEDQNLQQKNAREIALWSPVIVMIFKELLEMKGWWKKRDLKLNKVVVDETECVGLQKYLPAFFRFGVKFLITDMIEIRLVLQEFMEAIGEEYINDRI